MTDYAKLATMRILGIETSCDETAVAVVDAVRGRLTIRSSVLTSQITTHRRFGGVVPEVAAREHVPAILPLLKISLRGARTTLKRVDLIAVTSGPGLMAALSVGVETARALSWASGIPLLGVNHVEGHLAANWLGAKPRTIRFPVLGLVVSGGHTELIAAPRPGAWRLVGLTRDDAAGECFDKVAKVFGLGYPGGPAIAKLAAKGNPTAFHFPRPMETAPGYDFSFAGLKTSVLYFLQKKRWVGRPPKTALLDLCASFQQTIVDTLVNKSLRATRALQPKTFLLAGGVAANRELRRQLRTAIAQRTPNTLYCEPAIAYCTDNAAMIAAAASFHRVPSKTTWRRVAADPNWELVSRT